PGSGFTVHVTSRTAAPQTCPATYPNTAFAQATNAGDPVNASASVTVNCAAIEIHKVANPTGPVSAGDSIGFDLTVHNGGAGTAKNVVVSDALPSGGDLNWSLSPALTGCFITGAVGSQRLDCTFATLGPGASVRVHVPSPPTRLDS